MNTSKSQPMGRVVTDTRSIVEIRVEIDEPLNDYDADALAEYHVVLNGRVIRRMTYGQAMRLGLISQSSRYSH